MTLQTYFKTFVKNNQSRYQAKAWHDKIATKEIEKNNYLATGDVRQAKAFALAVNNFKVKEFQVSDIEPTLIFSREMLRNTQVQPNYAVA